MKNCPYCAEEIQSEAIKCKHCGEFLNGAGPPRIPATSQPWYFRPWVILLGLGSVGPLALPLVWWHPKLMPGWKIGITLATLALTWAMYAATVESLKMLKEIERALHVA